MASGRFGAASASMTFTDAPGGSQQAIAGYVTGPIVCELRATMEDVTAMGDSTKKTAPTGITETPNFSFTGPWDTTASTSPHVVFAAVDDGPQDAMRSLVVTLGDSKTFTVPVRVEGYTVTVNPGGLSTFKADMVAEAGSWGG